MKRIAIVEDSPDNRLLVTALLEGEYETVEFEDGEVAVAGLAASKPDLILLDISLPKMSGAQVLDWLRGQPELSSLPIVALTAHAMVGDREKFLGQGFDGYVAKPIVDEQDLFSVIRELLGD